MAGIIRNLSNRIPKWVYVSIISLSAIVALFINLTNPSPYVVSAADLLSLAKSIQTTTGTVGIKSGPYSVTVRYVDTLPPNTGKTTTQTNPDGSVDVLISSFTNPVVAGWVATHELVHAQCVAMGTSVGSLSIFGRLQPLRSL